ncbi:hypothetical protein KVT40_004007 [Elsinoe batatas]|uniref:RING-type domain-containing protein n=1 Tax=Elsinoe batatas TaxID=2601811 RepID=A0A8K0L467_9PEZI|nr:hypothetical protein KVT40_004007 [Elsinoe batatas]
MRREAACDCDFNLFCHKHCIHQVTLLQITYHFLSQCSLPSKAYQYSIAPSPQQRRDCPWMFFDSIINAFTNLSMSTPTIRRSRRIAGQPAATDFSAEPSTSTSTAPATVAAALPAPPAEPARPRTRRVNTHATHEQRARARNRHPPPTLRPAQQHPPPPEGPFTFTHSDPAWPGQNDTATLTTAPTSQPPEIKSESPSADVDMTDAPDIKQEQSDDTQIGSIVVPETTPSTQLQQAYPPLYVLDSDEIAARTRRILAAADNESQAAARRSQGADRNEQTTTARTLQTHSPIPMQSTAPQQIPTSSAPPIGTLQAPPAMSTNTSSSQEAKGPPTHPCVICCDSLPEEDMKQPCRFCKEWFCGECIADMFDRAIDTPTAMPPKCHMIFQLHTGLPLLSPERAQMFRDKFEEWLAIDKVYCPIKTCATFIPERVYHPGQGPAPRFGLFARSQAEKIVAAVIEHPTARHFMRNSGETALDSSGRPQSFHAMKRVKYDSWGALVSDLQNIIDKATRPGVEAHAAAKATLINVAANTWDKIMLRPSSKVTFPMEKPKVIACPTCCIGICLECRQTAHAGKPCDTTVKDHEIAMMAQYGYKQCPVCRTAVKRMFGCSHMQCLCGAHWCWRCEKHIDECGGGCNEGDEEDASDYGEAEYDGISDPGDMMDPADNPLLEPIAQNPVAQAGQQHSDVLAYMAEPADLGVRPPDHEITIPPQGLATDATAARTDAHDMGMPGQGHPPGQGQPPGPPVPDVLPTGPAATTTPATLPGPIQPNPAPSNQPIRPADHQPADLDAGGGRRWEGFAEFGDEPNEPMSSVWTCHHHFKHVTPRSDNWTVKLGSVVECNRCFKKMEIARRNVTPVAPSSKKNPEIKLEPQQEIPVVSAAPTARGPEQHGRVLGVMQGQRPLAFEEAWGTAQASSTVPPPAALLPSSFDSEPPRRSGTSRRNTNTLAAKKEKKEETEREDMPFDCRACNVLYCGECKDIMLERRRAERKR